MYDKILIPTDGSQTAEVAIEHAIDHAERYDAELHALYVVDIDAVNIALGTEQVDRIKEGKFHEMTEVKEKAERALEVVNRKASGRGIDVTEEIRAGQPFRVIRDYVDDNDIDLVVIGSHGRGGFKRRVMGSVTERVLRSTALPVLVVDAKATG